MPDLMKLVRSFIITCVVSLVFSVPVAAQYIFFVGFGEYQAESERQLVGELAVATMVGPLVPNLLLTFGLDRFSLPIVQPQLGATIIRGPTADLSLDLGASADLSDYTDWEPHFALTGVAYLVGPFRLAVTYAWQPWNDWAHSSVVKLEMPF